MYIYMSSADSQHADDHAPSSSSSSSPVGGDLSVSTTTTAAASVALESSVAASSTTIASSSLSTFSQLATADKAEHGAEDNKAATSHSVLVLPGSGAGTVSPSVSAEACNATADRSREDEVRFTAEIATPSSSADLRSPHSIHLSRAGDDSPLIPLVPPPPTTPAAAATGEEKSGLPQQKSSSSSSCDNEAATSAYHSASGPAAASSYSAKESSREERQEDEDEYEDEPNSPSSRRGASTVEKMSADDRNKSDIGGDESRGDVDDAGTTVTATQPPHNGGSAHRKAPRLHRHSKHRSSYSGPRTPATARLAASGVVTEGDSIQVSKNDNGDAGGGNSGPAASSPSSSRHRHHLQLPTAAPPLIAVDAPVSTLTLEVASTRSSPSSSSLPLEVSYPKRGSAQARRRRSNAKGREEDTEKREEKEKASVPAAVQRSPPPAQTETKKEKVGHRGSWSTPLFSSSDSEIGEEETAQDEREKSGAPAPEVAEEETVGKTVVVPVVGPTPIPTVEPLTNTQETAHVPSKSKDTDAAQPPSVKVGATLAATAAAPIPFPPSAPSASSSSSTPPVLLPLPLSATAEVAAAVALPSHSSDDRDGGARALPQSAVPPSAAATTPAPLPAAASSSSLPPPPPVTADTNTAIMTTSPPPPPPPPTQTSIAASATLSSIESEARSPGTTSSVLPAVEHGEAKTKTKAAVATMALARTTVETPLQLDTLTAKAATPLSRPAATTTPAAAIGGGGSWARPFLSQHLSVANSADTSSVTAANSLTLESTGQVRPRLSISGIPANSIGGLSPLTMAQFAHRSTASTGGSYHEDGGHHSHNDSQHTSSSYGSYSYSYYSSSDGYESSTGIAGSPHTPTPAPAATPAVASGIHAQGSSSFSTWHQRELSETRVGSADGLHGIATAGGAGSVVELTAYEEVAPMSADAAASHQARSAGGKLGFLRGLCRKPSAVATGEQRTWRTEERVRHRAATSAAALAHPPPTARTGADASSTAVGSSTTSAPAGSHERQGADTGSTVDPVSVTASVAGEGDEKDARNPTDAGSVTEAGHDRDSGHVATDEGNDMEAAAAAVVATPAAKADAESGQLHEAEAACPEQPAPLLPPSPPPPPPPPSVETRRDNADKTAEQPLPASADLDSARSPSSPPPPADMDVRASQLTSADYRAPACSPSQDSGSAYQSASVHASAAPASAAAVACENEQNPQQQKRDEPTNAEASELRPSTSSLSTSTDFSESDTEFPFGVVVECANESNTTQVAEDHRHTPAVRVDRAKDIEQMDLKEEEGNRAALTSLAHGDEDAVALHSPASEKPDSSPPSPQTPPLKAYYVYLEELPRLYAWDAEPPTTPSDEEASVDREHEEEEERWAARLQREAAAAAVAAQSALQSTLNDMAVHPPRQCLFVELHELRRLSQTLLCPRHATRPFPMQDDSGEAVEAVADVWRGGGGWGGTGTHREDAVVINGVKRTKEAAAEDPVWVEARLAVYSNDRQHLIAAGSTFTLPANAAALHRCDRGTGYDGGGCGRDSWSDLLVYQLEEPHRDNVDEQGERQGDKVDNVAANGRRRSAAVSSASVASVSEASSAFNTAAFYIQLEEKKERWVPVEVEEEQEGEGRLRAPQTSLRALEAETMERRAAQAASDDDDESVEWKTDSDAMDANLDAAAAAMGTASLPSSESPLTGRHVDHLIQAHQHELESSLSARNQAEEPDVSAGVDTDTTPRRRATEDAQQSQQQQRRLRLEEYWCFLAVSSPLPMAQLRRLPANGPSFAAQMIVPASPMDGSGSTHQEQALPCRVRWAVEPPPPTLLANAAPMEGEQQEQETDSRDAVWESLGSAVALYEDVRRGRGGVDIFDGCSPSAMRSSEEREGGQDGDTRPMPAAAAAPLTVLWNTIHSPAAAARFQEAEIAVVSQQRQRWRGGGIDGHMLSATPPARLQCPAVCSVVMRCSVAVLLPQPAADQAAARQGKDGRHRSLLRTYCVPTVLSVTGGLDGFISHTEARTRAPAATSTSETDLACRTPVMRYNLDFHTLLTREEASSLLLTVQSPADSSHVFGFAEFNPFERVESELPQQGTMSCVTDLWLPLFAPADAAASAAEAQVHRHRSSASSALADAAHTLPDGLATSVKVTGSRNVDAGDMVHAGWLHCDVNMVFCGSLAEAAMQRLWNGTTHSLASLELAAAALAAGGEVGELANIDDDGREDMDSVVDVCVVEAAGLQPLVTRFGASLPPRSRAWDAVARGDGGRSTNAGAADAPRCTHVYCEAVALQRDEATHPQAVRGSPTGSAALYKSTHSRGSAAGLWSSTASVGVVDDCEEQRTFTNAGAAAAHSAPPVTAAVAHTNHPQWRHTFRCCLASLSSLCLRVFDRAGPSRGNNNSSSTEDGKGARGRGTPANRSTLLGTVTVTSWMLRRVFASVHSSDSGSSLCEGGVWLPLLWTPTSSAPDSRRSVDRARLSQTLYPARSNGYVLVQWRRAPSVLPRLSYPPRLGVGIPLCCSYVSVTRRCQPPTSSSLPNARRLKAGSAGGLGTRLLVTRSGLDVLSTFPARWYEGLASPQLRSHGLTWMSPELAPWLWVHRLRLQWPWLQHVLTMRGGHFRLSVVYVTSREEQRVVDQFLLVPLSQVQCSGDSDKSRRHGSLRTRHFRAAGNGSSRSSTSDGRGVFCVVSAVSLSLDAPPRAAVAAAAPMEATFCLPASRCVEFQLWWYPNTMAFPALTTAASTTTAAAAAVSSSSSSCPPRLLGRGVWRFPAAALVDVSSDDIGDDGLSSGAGSTSEAVSDGDRGGDDDESACALHRFFVPHEADVQLLPVSSTELPLHVEGGVLQWQLSSVPRLTCVAWGQAADGERKAATVSTQAPRQDYNSLPDIGTTLAENALRWQWPDVGTAATLQVRVHHLLWFNRADEAAVAATAGKMTLAIEEVRRPDAGQTQTPADLSSTADGACWTAPNTWPKADVPRVPYVLSSSDNTPCVGGGGGVFACGSNAGDGWSDRQSSAASSQSPGRQTAFSAASIGCSASRNTAAHSATATGVDVSAASPAVELRWTPRRFDWWEEDAPTIALWVLSAEDKSSGTAGQVRDDSDKDEGTVWGSVQLPRLEAFRNNAGALWLPLFRTYEAVPAASSPAHDLPNGAGGSEAETRGDIDDDDWHHPGTSQHQQDALQATERDEKATSATLIDARCVGVAVQHVGFAAVSYTHNFARTEFPTPRPQPAAKGNAKDACDAVSSATSRLLLLQVGPLRCRYAGSGVVAVKAEKEKEGESLKKAARSNDQSTSSASKREKSSTSYASAILLQSGVIENDVASVSYSSDDFTASSSAPAAPPLPSKPSSQTHSSSTPSSADRNVAEVLIGFETHQVTVPVLRADTDTGASSAMLSSVEESDMSPQMVVFPWRNTLSRSNGKAEGTAGDSRVDVRTVRVQTQLFTFAHERVAVSNTLSVSCGGGAVASMGKDGKNCVGSGAQWIPLVAWHRALHTGLMATAEETEGDCVLGEILVHGRLVDRPSSLVGRQDRLLLTGEELQLSRLVERFCGGPGAPCSYAVLSNPTATVATTTLTTQRASLVSGGVNGDANARTPSAAVVGEMAAGRVRTWASPLSTTHASTPAVLQASELHGALCRAGPVRHPCVYLLVDHLQLQCSDAQWQAWQQQQQQQQRRQRQSTDSDAVPAYRFRLAARITWPAEWDAAWLRTVPLLFSSTVPIGLTDTGAVGPKAPSKESRSLTVGADSRSVTAWADVVDGVLIGGDDTASSSGAADLAVEHTLRCACAPLCLPLPAPQYIERVLGLPGLTAPLHLSFELFALPSTASTEFTTTGGVDKIALEKASELETLVCVGAGRSPLPIPQVAYDGMTSLVPPVPQHAGKTQVCTDRLTTTPSTAAPLLLSWRAHVSESVSLVRAGGAAAAFDAALQHERESSDASLSVAEAHVFDHALLATATRRGESGRCARRGQVLLARLTVRRMEMAGVDVSLACGVAQRHRQALAPAMIAVMVGDVESAIGERATVGQKPQQDGSRDDDNGNYAEKTAEADNEASASMRDNAKQASATSASSTVFFTPSRVTNTRSAVSSSSSRSPLAAVASRASLNHRTPPAPPPQQQQQQQQRYTWTTEVCVEANVQLVLYVRVAEAALRAARGEEMWSTAEDAEAPFASAQASASRDLVGKAVYVLDATEWALRPQQRSLPRQQEKTQEVVLDLESLLEGRWMGRLWLEVRYAAASAVLRDPRETFLSTRLSLTVRSCSGLVAGDMPLTRKVEETYQALRERVKEKYERRGRVPRRLRQHVKEARLLRRQLVQEANSIGRLYLVCAVEAEAEEAGKDGASSALTSVPASSRPFQLASAAALVRAELALESAATTTTTEAAESARELVTRETLVTTSGPLLRLSQSVDHWMSGHREGAAAVDLLFELRLVPGADSTQTAAEAARRDEAVRANDEVAVGRVRLPLPLLHADRSFRPSSPSYTQHLCLPLTLQTSSDATTTMKKITASEGNSSVTHEKKERVAPQRRVMTVSHASAGAPATLAVEATWSVVPSRGDTFVTCLLLEAPPGVRSLAGSGYRHWLLRWVYVFESSANPEVEHVVDTPLSLTPASPRAAPVEQSRMPWMKALDAHRVGDGAGASCYYWSGATTQLPRIGAVGASLCRVELVEATPPLLSSAAVAPALQPAATGEDVYTAIRLAQHLWSVEDELELKAKRRLAQQTGEDACMWLHLASSCATSGRPGSPFRVLLGLYTSNAVAQHAAHRLEQQMTASADGAALLPSRSLLLVPRAQGDVNTTEQPKPMKAASIRKTIGGEGASAGTTTTQARGAGDTDCPPSAGGVVMKNVIFRCSDAALAQAGLHKVNVITCRAVRVTGSGGGGRENRKEAQNEEPQSVHQSRSSDGDVAILLDIGQATQLLQTGSSSLEADNATTAAAAATTTTLPTPARITATWACVSREAPTSAVACAPSVFQRPRQNLLRLDIPTGTPVLNCSVAGPPSCAMELMCGDDCSATANDAPLRLEVCVHDGDACVQLVSAPFTASYVLQATVECSPKSAHSRFAEPAWLSWTTKLPLHRAEPLHASAADSQMEVELQWGLDLLGIQPALAVVPCVQVPWAGCCSSSSNKAKRRSGTREGEAEAIMLAADSSGGGGDTASEDGDATLEQLVGCAAWVDFLTNLRSQEQLHDQQVHLRHWRCRIVGVEVEGLELPMWTAASEGPCNDRRCGRLGMTTLLAQLNFATKHQTERQEEKGPGNGKSDDEHTAPSGTAEDCVLGVARSTAVSVLSTSRNDPGTRVTGSDAASQRHLFSARQAPTYRAFFAPLSWCIGLHDMIRCGRVATRHADGDVIEHGAERHGATLPPPGLSLWQLLTPTAAAAAAAAAAAVTATQEVYELGAVQLSQLLQEGALFLVQVLARWSSGTCTREERDTLLSAASSFPTQWMPLASTDGLSNTPRKGDRNRRGARVRFYYSFAYDGPSLSASPTATVLNALRTPPTTANAAVPVPVVMADAVHCAWLDHVRLLCPSAQDTATRHDGARRNDDPSSEAASKWLSCVLLRMHVVQTTVDAADETHMIDTRVVARWTTRLAPLPLSPQLKQQQPPSTPVAKQFIAPAPIPVPVSVPLPAASSANAVAPPSAAPTPASASCDSQEKQDAVSVHETTKELPPPPPPQQQQQETPSVFPVRTDAIPALPTTSCFCWQPARQEGSARLHAAAVGDGDGVAGTVVSWTIEVDVVVLPDSPEAATTEQQPRRSEVRERRGNVVGHGCVSVGRTQASTLWWDRTEERLDEGWRLIAPLPVSISVATPFSQSEAGDGAGARGAPEAPVLSFDLLAFTAPSWGLVTALQAAQCASRERQLRRLTTLHHTAARLLTALAASSAPGPSASRGALPQLSADFIAHPYRVLRVPPAVYRLDTFAIVDVVEQVEERHRVVRGNTSVQGGQSLWSLLPQAPEGRASRRSVTGNTSGCSDTVCRKVWLVNAATGEVRTPCWQLLPSLLDTASNEEARRSNDEHLLSLSGLPAGRVLVQERARLRLEWCRSADSGPAASLAGLIGGAVVSYAATNGDACMWVSGGLRLQARRAWPAHDSAARPGVRDEAAPSAPSPPPRARVVTASASPQPSLRRRSAIQSNPCVAAACGASSGGTAVAIPVYQLYTSHYVCHSAAAAADEKGKDDEAGDRAAADNPPLQQWKVEVDASVLSSAPLSSTPGTARLFHTATQLSDGRVWLLGGWRSCDSGAVTDKDGRGTSAVLPATEGLYARPPAVDFFAGAGLVERRRIEVRQAAAAAAAAAVDLRSTTTLQWCETVSCVQCMADGTPAPPIDVVPSPRLVEPPPRVACHVAAACGHCRVLLFGGLTPNAGEGSRLPPARDFASATAAVHVYDTLQGIWSRISAAGAAAETSVRRQQQPWPMARYGHSCAVVPGTGGTQPQSYFVFGGATTRPVPTSATTTSVCELVPPEELLWIWAPYVDADGQVQCAWRRVQMPADLPSPLAGRFLPQLLALSAAEVLMSALSSASSTGMMEDWMGREGEGAGIAAADPGLTSLVLCVTGGMTQVVSVATAAARLRCAAGGGGGTAMVAEEANRGDSALGAFRQYVEPWLPCPTDEVTTVLLTTMCERPVLQT